MECPECGAVVAETDLYCDECGAVLPGASAEAPPPAAAQGLPTVDAGPPAAPPRPVAPPLSRPRSGLVVPLIVALIALSLLCLLGVGVLVAVMLGDSPPVEPTAVGPQPGQVVLEDSFDDPTSGWDIYTEDDTWAGYVDGEYRLGVYRSDFVTWANPLSEETFSNFEIEVDARQVEGSVDNNFGVLARYQSDDENFYWFEISGDGFYSVDLLQDDEWVTLVSWAESSAINQGVGATNHLKVVCSDDQFSFYVNGAYLTGVTDATFQSGNVGLAVGTFDEAGVVVHFDNLRVSLLQD